ncbi:MAG: hypothetical protein JWP88_1471 [Flaviaesturariibacter sp.]|nr:hypothetical protein [Flaviaesturariibacter sp.]
MSNLKPFLLTAILVTYFTTASLAQRPVLTYNRGNVTSIKWVTLSPDAKYVLTTDQNKEAVLWQTSTGSELNRFTGVESAAFNSNTEIVFVLDNKRKTVKTDLRGNILFTYPAQQDYRDHSNVLWNFQPKEGVLISGDRIYKIDNGGYTEPAENNISLSQPTALYVPSQRVVVKGGDKGIVCVFDATSGQLKDSVRFNYDESYNECLWAGMSEDGTQVGIIEQRALYVKDRETRRTRLSLTASSSNFFVTAAFLGRDKMLVVDEQAVSLYDLTTAKPIWKQKHHFVFASYGDSRGFISLSADHSKALVGSGYQKNLLLMNMQKGDSLVALSSPSFGNTLTLQTEYADNKLALVGEGKVFKINLRSGRLEDNSNPGFFVGGKTLVYNDNTLYAGEAGFASSYVTAYDINNKNEYKKAFQVEIKNQVRKIRPTSDKKYIAVTAGTTDASATKCEKNVLYLFNSKGEKMWQSSCENLYGIGMANKRNIMAMSTEDGSTGAIAIREVENGNVIKNIKPRYLDYPSEGNVFSPNDNYLLAISNHKNELIDLNRNESYFFSGNLPDGKPLSTIAFSPDESALSIGSFSGNVFTYDMAAHHLNERPLFNTNAGMVEGLQYSEKGDFLFVSSKDNTIYVWDLKNNTLAATIYTNYTGKEFTVVTPDGRFDSKGSDFANLYYVKDLSVVPLAATFETFYTPGLLSRVLAREKFDPIPVNVFDIHPQPVINIDFKDGKSRNLVVQDNAVTFVNETGVAEITLSATAPEDVVEEMRLFHNGKAVNLTTRNLFVTDAGNSTNTKTYTINLLPGANQFRAIALNKQRTESLPKEMEVVYKAKAAVGTVTPAPLVNSKSAIGKIDKTATLYLVVVGINKYQNEKLSLNYALADATAFKEEIEKDAKTVIDNVKTFFVTDAVANKKGISDAFSAVQKLARPQDIFVFYYAGHGVISAQSKEFYLVPTDVADLTDVDASLIEKGISSRLLQEFAVSIPAQKQVFILDACQSAGAFETMLRNDGDQQKSLAVVARSTGTHWIAASGSQQFANEFSQLGHGAFTYVLLQALKGSALSNGMITVNGLKNFLQAGVPELMKKYNGAAQYPASYGFGADFPVEVRK